MRWLAYTGDDGLVGLRLFEHRLAPDAGRRESTGSGGWGWC